MRYPPIIAIYCIISCNACQPVFSGGTRFFFAFFHKKAPAVLGDSRSFLHMPVQSAENHNAADEGQGLFLSLHGVDQAQNH